MVSWTSPSPPCHKFSKERKILFLVCHKFLYLPPPPKKQDVIYEQPSRLVRLMKKWRMINKIWLISLMVNVLFWLKYKNFIVVVHKWRPVFREEVVTSIQKKQICMQVLWQSEGSKILVFEWRHLWTVGFSIPKSKCMQSRDSIQRLHTFQSRDWKS